MEGVPQNTVKCTYQDCLRHFPTNEAMKKHKAKDGTHSYYCKRCDEDCIDDDWLLFHQITSLKHIACPVCGREFKSVGGRDRHVDIDHPPKQKVKLPCAGCNESFDSASGLMAHIEGDKCNVIRKEHFYSQRAERQISKDAWKAAEDIYAGSTIPSRADKSHVSHSDVDLLDDERAWVEMDWAGNPIMKEEIQPFDKNVAAIGSQVSDLSVEKFPVLGSGSAQASGVPQIPVDTNVDLLADTPVTKSSPANLKNNHFNSRWAGVISGQNGNVSGTKVCGQRSVEVHNDKDAASTLNSWQSMASYKTAPATKANSILVPVSQSLNQPENAHVTTAIERILPANADINKYWDPLSEQYTCPGCKSNTKFRTVDAFKKHLLSDSHVGATVICPGCQKRFRSTTALVAHCESASRKCTIRNAIDFDMVIRDITAGMISADGYQEDGSSRYTAQKIEDW